VVLARFDVALTASASEGGVEALQNSAYRVHFGETQRSKKEVS
jgi:hypothetical protein